ncbi:hypothetical protein ACE1CI_27095 [Aerosakkonemataceae cyanobacterium BLCC-F50]|uniref:Uncharacterized protein n=1 Tax=Floridaenema flaviceps BLCC-F50 TaxID=3153642 RepID=A0ABV4XZW9_9CYAN
MLFTFVTRFTSLLYYGKICHFPLNSVVSDMPTTRIAIAPAMRSIIKFGN